MGQTCFKGSGIILFISSEQCHEDIDIKWTDLQPDNDERDWRDLVKLGLFMRRVALDRTLSRRCRDLGAPPQKWEQYSREGRI